MENRQKSEITFLLETARDGDKERPDSGYPIKIELDVERSKKHYRRTLKRNIAIVPLLTQL